MISIKRGKKIRSQLLYKHAGNEKVQHVMLSFSGFTNCTVISFVEEYSLLKNLKKRTKN